MGLSLSSSSAIKRRQQRQKLQPSQSGNLQLNQPLRQDMNQVLEKITIERDAANRTDTDHLLPVIEFLKAQGYTPATGDVFYFDRDGLGTYGFAEPLDTAGLQDRFVFPPSVKVTPTSIYDTRHFVTIKQSAGEHIARPMSFEV